jgi:hypothetical protein
MLIISSKKGLRPAKVVGGVILFLGGFFVALTSYWQLDTLSAPRIVAIFLLSYFFWGMQSKTEVYPAKVVKRRGWFFPSFKSEYNQLRNIKLDSQYIFNEGYGAHSFYALYVGVVNGPFNEVVDLSWAVNDSDNGQEYVEFTKQLRELTGLPVVLTEEFKAQFNNKFDYCFPDS